MNENNSYKMPDSMWNSIEQLSDKYPVALLLRHSARDVIVEGEIGNDVPLTEQGKNMAHQMGQMLVGKLKSLHSSPILRCLQTAECLKDGSGIPLDIATHRFLGDPGVFVLDGKIAWQNWKNLGNAGVIQHLILSNDALPGMEQPEKASSKLLNYLFATISNIRGVHIFVTHDVILAPIASRFLRGEKTSFEEPAFLEGALFWRSETGTYISYKNKSSCID